MGNAKTLKSIRTDAELDMACDALHDRGIRPTRDSLAAAGTEAGHYRITQATRRWRERIGYQAASTEAEILAAIEELVAKSRNKRELPTLQSLRNYGIRGASKTIYAVLASWRLNKSHDRDHVPDEAEKTEIEQRYREVLAEKLCNMRGRGKNQPDHAEDRDHYGKRSPSGKTAKIVLEQRESNYEPFGDRFRLGFGGFHRKGGEKA